VATICAGACARECVCMLLLLLLLLLCVVVVVVVVVGVRVSMRAPVSSHFLSLLVCWWLCMCLAVSGFRSLGWAFGLVIEVCRVVIVLVLSVGLWVLCVCILYFYGLVVFACEDFLCGLCFP